MRVAVLMPSDVVRSAVTNQSGSSRVKSPSTHFSRISQPRDQRVQLRSGTLAGLDCSDRLLSHSRARSGTIGQSSNSDVGAILYCNTMEKLQTMNITQARNSPEPHVDQAGRADPGRARRGHATTMPARSGCTVQRELIEAHSERRFPYVFLRCKASIASDSA